MSQRKIALITDTHFGARRDSATLHDYFEKFYKTQFFPTLKARRDVTSVIHLGDVFDHRKTISFYSLKRAKEYFFDPLADVMATSQIERVDFLVGNHDAYFKNTNELNSLEQLLSRQYSMFNVHATPTITSCEASRPLVLFPWICEQTRSASFEIINNPPPGAILFGHLELINFEMTANNYVRSGDDHRLFRHFERVFTGHYHKPSTRDNVTYLGAPYEMTWADYGDARGFHIFCPDTLELEFIPNSHNLFMKIHFGRDDAPPASEASGRYVRVIVPPAEKMSKEKVLSLDAYVADLHAAGAVEVTVVDDHRHVDEIDVANYRSDDGDTPLTSSPEALLKYYADALNVSEDLGKRVNELLEKIVKMAHEE